MARRRPEAPEGEAAERYAALVSKYRELAAQYERAVDERTGVSWLGQAAVRASTAALATLRCDDDRVAARNTRWAQWAVQDGPAWQTVAASGRRIGSQHATLESFAVAEARALLKAGEPQRELRLERPGGGEAVDLRLERITDDGGGDYALMVISDVTVRSREEREIARVREQLLLQERIRAVGELASGVAHDLNNTLNALGLRLAHLSSSGCTAEDRQESLRSMERILRDASARVRRLQDVAARRQDRPTGVVDLNATIAQAVAAARLDLVKRPASGPIAIAVEAAPLPLIRGDGAELCQVLASLLLNAREAMPLGGQVRLAARASRNRVILTVEDEGAGIPEAHLPRVFDPFFTTKGEKGTGLGLAIAAGVIRRLGGSIAARNRSDGGAELVLELPVADAPAAEATPPQPPGAGIRPGRRVLVVDDDPDNLEAMSLLLEEYGQEVEVTDSGLEAIRRVQSGARYDVVLCDLGLLDVTGWEVARGIGQAASGARVVLVTGWAEEIPGDDPRRSLVSAILPKPLELPALERALSGAWR
jgi:signal transduction histidine kinase